MIYGAPKLPLPRSRLRRSVMAESWLFDASIYPVLAADHVGLSADKSVAKGMVASGTVVRRPRE